MHDVIVVGLGGVGGAAACHLAGRGQRVLALDRFAPPHQQGSSHGKTRIIRQAYFEDPAYVPLVMRSYELWRELERETDSELLRVTGGLMVGPPECDVVEGSVASAREHDLPYRMLTPDDVAARFPSLRLDRDETAVWEPSAGVLFAEDCVRAHLELAARRGAELRTGEPVTAWSAGGGHVRVETTAGRYEAGRLLLAAGAWSPGLLHLDVPLRIERQVMTWLEPAERREAFDASGFPIVVWDYRPEEALYLLPETRGEGVKAGFHHGGRTLPDAGALDEPAAEDVERLRRLLRERAPWLDGRLRDAQTCMYANTPDEHFAIGPHPDHAEVVVAAGFSGHGFKFCAVLGEMLAELVARGETRHPLAPFRPDRFAASG